MRCMKTPPLNKGGIVYRNRASGNKACRIRFRGAVKPAHTVISPRRLRSIRTRMASVERPRLNR